MNYPGIWKECKFCSMRYEQGTAKCPKCGSANARLVMPKEVEADRIFFAEEKVRKDKEQAEKQAKKKKSLRKWKKAFRILGIIAGIFLLICIVGSFLIGCWAMWMSQKETEKWLEDTESTESIVTNININETQEPIREEALSDEEWLKYVLPILDEWYAKNADEEILKIHKKALDENRPIYMWDHYMYAAALYDFSDIEDMWEREQAGEILQDYENADLLNYYLMYWDFEESYSYTDEEKVWLQQYVNKLREDVEWRWGRTDSELKALYEDMTVEYGYVDYQKVKEYVENSNVWIASLIKATMNMEDEAWKSTVFPKLDELFEEGRDEELILIYYNTKQQYQEGERPFSQWRRNRYVEYMWEVHSLEPLLQDLEAGKRLHELDYKTIIMTYFEYAYYEEEYYFDVEEKKRFAPHFERLEECVNGVWDFTQPPWKTLLTDSKIKNVGNDVEWYIYKWLRQTYGVVQADEPEISE